VQPSNKEVLYYHDGTKHSFARFARSLGYLDWASQPAPFRSYTGSRVVALYPSPDAPHYTPPAASYDQLFSGTAAPVPFCTPAIGDLLRHSLGLSAWKRAGASRWSLRVNPSSGNLHPTEAYLACGSLDGLGPHPAVYHYAPDRHVLEERCACDDRRWRAALAPDHALVALTSIHWREAWKYGERAFRYCQHDIGHAIAALTYAAAALGWTVRLLSWSHDEMQQLTGTGRDEDFADAEREEPACVLLIAAGDPPAIDPAPAPLLEAVAAGRWSGRASQLSEDHVQWTFIDEIAEATRVVDGFAMRRTAGEDMPLVSREALQPAHGPVENAQSARALLLQRRSAVAFDRQTSMAADRFVAMLDRLRPGHAVPWRTMWWDARVHLLLFVHRVDGLAPGLYLLPRSEDGGARLRAAIRPDFMPETIDAALPLVRLGTGDCRSIAERLSCDQEIASDGCFSVAMLAEFERALDEHGAAFYRHLFWETGVVGQALYLEAEAAGLRGTGIGCFYDDPVHELLGLDGHAYQSLYHFTVGGPVEDRRITIEPGYGWEARRF
jgi:SagB-type dehydrogenase family enzyme